MTDIECPCIDCITLAICKASIKSSIPIYDTLASRCSIFKKHYFEVHAPVSYAFTVELIELFRPDVYKKRWGYHEKPKSVY